MTEQQDMIEALPSAVRSTLLRHADNSKPVLSGQQLLASLSQRTGAAGHLDVDAHVVLRGKEEAETVVRQLAEGARVGGSLAVVEAGGAALAFPAGLSVGGALCFARGEQELAALSFGRGLRVGGDLDLGRCTALAGLPRDVRVGGFASAGGCSSLASIGEGFEAAGLDATGCTALTGLPEGLRSSQGCIFVNCAALERLPGGMDLAAGLMLNNCPALAQLPEDLHVSGDLFLDSCAALTRLPQAIQVDGDLIISNCPGLTSLPAGLTVVGLVVSDCAGLTALPEGLRTTDRVSVVRCPAVTALPADLQQVGTLWLEGCTALTALPDGLRVGDDCGLMGCSALTALPEELHVSGHLDATGCVALTALPDRFYVDGHVVLTGCSALESLPASLLDWPEGEEAGGPHAVVLGGTGLSREALAWLQQANAPGVAFHVSLEALEGGADSDLDDDDDGDDDDDDVFGRAERVAFASAQQAAAFWVSVAQEGHEGDEQQQPAVPEVATLVQFLSRLRDAKEFAIAETRKALAKRVVAVLELLSREDGGGGSSKEEMLTRMGDSLDTCGDKPVWALNQIHLAAEVAKRRGDADALRALGRRVMRLMVVHEHAKRKVDSLRWVDDVCVFLRFEIDLREALDLPVDATAMIFPSYINVTDEDLESAKDAALAITDAQFEAWLADWSEWQRQQRHQVVAELRWQELAEIKRRQSLRKRASRRLSQLLNLSGDKMSDPVTLDDGKSVWSLSDLLKHWERTGMDLHNAPVPVEQLRSDLKRVVA